MQDLKSTAMMARSNTLCIALLLAISGVGAARADDWNEIRAQVFADRPIADARISDIVLYGPNQTVDSAMAPVSAHLSTALATRAKTLTLIIDRNPAPIAAVFHFGDAFREPGDVGDRVVATRIRVDSFSQVRAIVETLDGQLLMSSKFIAGAGGCSALPSKDPDEAYLALGRMKAKLTVNADRHPRWREALVMLRHPNFTGMQLNPKTSAYVPARFVRELRLMIGSRELVRMEGGISISEDPNLRVTFSSEATDVLVASGADTEGATFRARSDGPGS